ncbi:hypothetical protein RCL1_007653 [Eukaryota sp. TZLM3-RCL]
MTPKSSCPPVIKTKKNISSSISLVEDSEGTRFCKKNIGRSLSKQEISFLSSLQHPGLVGYYSAAEQDTNDLLFDYCEFGLFSDIDVSQQELSSHDLWSIRKQLLNAVEYLASQGLYHNGLNVSNVLVCSLYPISIKLSLFSNSRVLIDSVNTEISIQEFWKQKMNEQEEVCFDDLIRSIVNSVFPYSIIDKNINFTNPNTLERNDLESLKALICSTESETMFKSGQCIGDFSSVNTTVSHVFQSFNGRKHKNLFLSNSLLFHVFTQEILKFERPLLEFNIDNSEFKSWKKDFSNFATKMISVSLSFRNVFLRSLEFACSFNGHSLRVGDVWSNYDSTLVSHCYNMSYHLSPSVVFLNFLTRCPITSIATRSLSFDTGVIKLDKVTSLELNYFNEDLSPITLFQSLSSISLTKCSITDLTPFSNIAQLTSFSLSDVDITDFSTLSKFTRLIKLSLDNCNFTDISSLTSLENLRILSLFGNEIGDFRPLSCLQFLEKLELRSDKITDISSLASLKNLVRLSLAGDKITDFFSLASLKNLVDLSLVGDTISDISSLASLLNLRILSLRTNTISDLSPLSCLQFLVSLNLSYNKITDVSSLASLLNLRILSLDGNAITDLRPLSSLFKLKKLSLYGTKVYDLWPLKNLTKLSTLDVGETLLPEELQQEVIGLSCVQEFLNELCSLESSINQSTKKRTCSSEFSLKKVNKGNRCTSI